MKDTIKWELTKDVDIDTLCGRIKQPPIKVKKWLGDKPFDMDTFLQNRYYDLDNGKLFEIRFVFDVGCDEVEELSEEKLEALSTVPPSMRGLKK